jgi:hypothetical protein
VCHDPRLRQTGDQDLRCPGPHRSTLFAPGQAIRDAGGFPRLPNVPTWDALTADQQKLAARKMEVYAAMIEYMDDQIGRLVAHLEQTGQLTNTLIVFLSDNGAAGEDMGELIATLSPAAREWFAKTYDNRLENIGRPGSCVEYGPAWAQVSSVPLRQFKRVQADGGIRVPLLRPRAANGVLYHGPKVGVGPWPTATDPVEGEMGVQASERIFSTPVTTSRIRKARPSVLVRLLMRGSASLARRSMASWPQP